ncbi:MAG: putative aminoglycoside phosphotransferase [Acidobacteria bacterium]|nr:putative aminoglycoside phosphotransferase [Acidobacteriota bacterium]
MVRPGEELDLRSLAAYLRGQLECGTGVSPADLRLEQFAGGHSNLTYLIRFGAEQFVLRRPPVGPVAPTAHDMPREFRLLQALHPHFSLAPRPILLCEDTAVIGVPFYLMERRHGLIVRDNIPSEIGDDETRRRRVSEAVVDTLAALHAVDIYATELAEIGKPVGFVGRQVRGWSERWLRSKTSEVVEMDQVMEWLGERIPSELNMGATIVHNDFKLDNIMLDPRDPARVVAVLDWEMCSVGDPLIDLGLLLCYWTLQSADEQQSLHAVTSGPGWMTRAEIIERYERLTGRDLSQIVFYETFARFKVAVIIQQIYFRYDRGQTRDERFRHFDRLVLELAKDAVKGLGY